MNINNNIKRRLIDANQLREGLEYHFMPTDQECELDERWATGYNAGLKRALYSIAYAHTVDAENDKLNNLFNLITEYNTYRGNDILAAIQCLIEDEEVKHIKPLE